MGVIFKNGISYGGGSSGGGSSSYIDLTNKPKINNVTLVGNKTTADLGLADASTIYINDNDELAVGVISANQIANLFN